MRIGTWKRNMFQPGKTAAVVLGCCVVHPADGRGADRVQLADAAGRAVAFDVLRSDATGLVTYARPVVGGGVRIAAAQGGGDATPIEFFRQFGNLFGVTDADAQLVPARRWTDSLGHRHAKFQQVHRGVPVFSGVLKVHEHAGGSVVLANGRFYPIGNAIKAEPTVGGDDAVATASRLTEAGQPRPEQVELVWVDPGWYGDPPLGVRLAYYVVLSDPAAGVREAFFVDAHNGEVFDQWSLVQTARDRRIHYDPGTGELPGILARSEGDEPVESVRDVDAAYDYFGDVYDYLLRGFGRDSLDGAGMPMIGTVQTRAVRCPNAFWSGAEAQAAFCTGTASDDVVAHELTHGLTQFTANLIHQNQPGQLDESFSDVFGELVDLFNGGAAFLEPDGSASWPSHPTGPGLDEPNEPRTAACSHRQHGFPDGVRWLIGEDAPAFSNALRDMWNPTCRGHPDRANSHLQTCDAADNGGVHSGSGIPNHAFAMLTDGKTFNGVTVEGIGPIKSGAVWHRALTTYLSMASDFQDTYRALNQAVADLIGTAPNDPRTGGPSAEPFTSFDAAQVDAALRAVEMDTPGFCGRVFPVLRSEPPPACNSRTTIYAHDFETDAGDWSVANTEPPTPYDWRLTSVPLPLERAGRAWFCPDRNIGDCDGEGEEAIHALFSPLIRLPEDTEVPIASWTHLMVAEAGWDGGNVRIRVNAAPWQLIPGSAFLFNPYNSVIRARFVSESNPLVEQEAWTGFGGGWGTSQVDLSGFAGPGDLVRLRFDFGKDRCRGLTGWFIDDFELYSCADCNVNGTPDSREFIFTQAAGPLGPVGVDAPLAAPLPSAPPAGGEVLIEVAAIADLHQADEYLHVFVNDVLVGRVFELTGLDCPVSPVVESLTVQAEIFNGAVRDDEVRISIRASEAVSASACAGSFVKLFVRYAAGVGDEDANGALDVCENCAVAESPASNMILHPTNRYLPLTLGSPGRLTALRVVPTDVPGPLAALAGQHRWVGPPVEIDGQDEEPPELFAAPLVCEPTYLDWSRYPQVHVFGREVAPGAAYRVEAIDVACKDRPGSAFFSKPAALRTPRWGDVIGFGPDRAPDGRVDIFDIVYVLDAFRAFGLGPVDIRADLYPALPDRLINVLDVVQTVEAFQGRSYPFTALTNCR